MKTFKEFLNEASNGDDKIKLLRATVKRFAPYVHSTADFKEKKTKKLLTFHISPDGVAITDDLIKKINAELKKNGFAEEELAMSAKYTSWRGSSPVIQATINLDSLTEANGKRIGPDQIKKGQSYIGIDLDNPKNTSEVEILSVSKDSGGMYDVSIKYKDTGKTESWYLEKSDLVFMAEAHGDKTFNEASLEQYKVTVGGKSYTILSTDKVRAAVSVIRSLTRSNKVESMIKTENDLEQYNVGVEVIPTKAHKIEDLLGN